MAHPLTALHEIHALSTEIQTKRQALRDKIRNADDGLVEVIINALLAHASTPAPAESKVKAINKDGKPRGKIGRPAKAKTYDIGPENVIPLVLSVMDETPCGPAEIFVRLTEAGILLNSQNPKTYLGYILNQFYKGKNARFRKVGPGQFLARTPKAAKGKTKTTVHEVAPFLSEDWAQRALKGIDTGADEFMTSELADRTKLNGKSLPNVFNRLRQMKILKNIGTAQWRVIDRPALRTLIKDTAPTKTNGHHVIAPAVEAQTSAS